MADLKILVREYKTHENVMGASVILDGLVRMITDHQGTVCFAFPSPLPSDCPHEIVVFRGFDFRPFILAIPHNRLMLEKQITVDLEAQPSLPENGIGYGIEAVGANSPPPAGIEKVRIGILDTGIDVSHPCLRVIGGCVTADVNPATTELRNLKFCKDRPISQHGTFTAGLISGQQFQNQGILGVAPGASLFDLRVFDTVGISASKDAICLAVRWAIENDIQILHVGFGSKEPSKMEEHIWQQAHEAGIVVLAPSGNTADNEKSVLYPAAFESTICIGAVGRITDIPEHEKPEISQDGNWFLPSFSRRGDEVDLVAPGVSICSIVPGLPNGKVSFEYCSGTSESVCFVTGIVARLLTEQLELSTLQKASIPETVRKILKNCAQPLDIPGTGAGLAKVWKSDSKYKC